jgi:hypothetical protein
MERMETKKRLLVAILFLISNTIFPTTPKRYFFMIWNYSSKNVVVERDWRR